MRIAINGFGRIGRCVLRAAFERGLLSSSAPLDGKPELQLVAINELADPDTIAYLTQYDSTHGRFPAQIRVDNASLLIDSLAEKNNASETASQRVKLLASADVSKDLWRDQAIDWVLDCTGELKTLSQASKHIEAGAAAVLLSNPGEPEIPAIVYGVNHDQVLQTIKLDQGSPKIISAASCTSNALIPAIAVLDQALGLVSGVITTIHAAMHDQPVIDAYHGTDLRKNRASSESFIPVSTELAVGVGRILPALAGKFVAQAIRVPVSNVSALNITINVKQSTTAQAVNTLLSDAAKHYPAEVLAVTDEPLASCDFVHHPCSGTVDAQQTQVVDGKTINLLIWFDNEWAFANRMLDIILQA